MQQLWLRAGAPLALPEPCVAIGNFDGVHRGHQQLVRAAVAGAERCSGTAVVLSFDPHPARVLAPDRAPGTLTTLAQKAELLAGLGVELLALLPFDGRLARLAPADFVRTLLVGVLRPRRVFVGAGFRFGSGRRGDVAELTRLGDEHAFAVEAMAPVLEAGVPVSSSRIRQALAHGAVEEARALLGRAYSIDGSVVAGDGRGRTIGVPTANLATQNEVVPARGVYAGRCRVGSDGFRLAVVNVGIRPTFGGTTGTIEAHLLDFDGDLYGRTLRLSFEHRLRDERRFESGQALVAQIRADVAHARRLLSGPADDGL